MSESHLPRLNEYGLLPAGLHDGSLNELEELFAPRESPQRRKLFANLQTFLDELRHAGWQATVIIDGSYVMAKVDGTLGPSDIDLLLILPPDWNFASPLSPAAYNLLSKHRVRQRFHFHVFIAAAHSTSESEAIAFLEQVNPKWSRLLVLCHRRKLGS